jgi:hypothetical protein
MFHWETFRGGIMNVTALIFALLALSTSAHAKAKPLTTADFIGTFDGTAAPAADSDFDGIARLPGCSGALVQFAGQSDSDHAMVLTNDHCLNDQAYGRFTYNAPYSKTVTLFNKKKEPVAKSFVSMKILYATQTDTDFGLLELPETYAEIKKLYDVSPLTLAPARAAVGADILVITGYFGKVIECQVDGYVHRLVEDSWTWNESYRYAGCETGHGTSGSPIVLKGTRSVVGINNTGNDDGGRCTLNNPCEVDAAGTVTVLPGRNYGQQTAELYTCLNERKQFDIHTPGCKLLGGDSHAAQ